MIAVALMVIKIIIKHRLAAENTAKYEAVRELVENHPDEPVLVIGETGTGKEIVAQSLHSWSRRTGEFRAPPVIYSAAFSSAARTARRAASSASHWLRLPPSPTLSCRFA